MGKGSATRARAVRNERKRQAKTGKAPEKPSAARTAPTPVLLAPTPQQESKGWWVRAKGPGRTEAVVNLASDMIGRLRCEGAITHEQEQAARLFQELRADFLAELGTRGYGSCLDPATGGYDGSDGDPQAMEAYRRMERRVGGSMMAVLSAECDKGAQQRPHMIGLLRAALTAVWGKR